MAVDEPISKLFLTGKAKPNFCFDTEGDMVLDSTDTVDTTDCVVMVIKEMMEELDYDSIFLTSIAL